MSDEHIHPQYGKPMSGKPRTWSGITYRPYRRGVMDHVWVSDDGRIEIADRSSYHHTFVCIIDGKVVLNDKGKPKYFHFQMNAAQWAANALKLAADYGQKGDA